MSVYPDNPNRISGRPQEFVVRGPKSFGAALREFRADQGISQAALAERAGLHRTYLSSVENGVTTEAVRNLLRALQALDLEVVVRPRGRRDQS